MNLREGIFIIHYLSERLRHIGGLSISAYVYIYIYVYIEHSDIAFSPSQWTIISLVGFSYQPSLPTVSGWRVCQILLTQTRRPLKYSPCHSNGSWKDWGVEATEGMLRRYVENHGTMPEIRRIVIVFPWKKPSILQLFSMEYPCFADHKLPSID